MDDKFLDRKRYFNIRILFLIFIGLIVGIVLSNNLFSSLFYNKPTTCFWVIFGLLMTFGIFTTVIYIIGKHKKCSVNTIGDIVVRNYKNVVVWMLSIVIGFAIFAPYVNLQEKREDYSGNGQIVATIVDIKEYNYSSRIVLGDISVGDVELVGKGIIFTSYNASNKLTVGDRITFLGSVESTIDTSGDDLYSATKSYLYNIKLDKSSNIECVNNYNYYQSFYQLRFNILKFFKKLFLGNMSKDNAELTYSMVFGDKNTLPDDTISIFRGVGVIHLLCVSGLHVGILVALVYGIVKWLANKFNWGYKASSLTIIITVTVFLLFYSYLCGFGVSVIRASIMAMVLLISKILGKKYDNLNSLSLAGIIILLLMPYQLFEVGFQLSFLCVFAIITFVPKLLEVTDLIKIPRWLATPFAISICVTLLIMPVLINTFGEASWLSIFANVIVVPLFGVVFTLVFYTMIIALIPFLGFVLRLSDIALQVLVRVVELFAAVPFGVIRCFRIGYIVVALLILLAVIVRYFMSTIKFKSVVASVICVAIVVLTIVGLMPANLSGSLAAINTYGEFNAIVFGANENVLVGSPNKYLSKVLLSMKTNLDSAVLFDITPNTAYKVSQYCNDLRLKTIYIPKYFEDYNSLINVNAKVVYFDEPLFFGDFNLDLCYNYSGKFSFVHLYNDDVSAAFVNDDWDSKDLSFVLTNYSDAFDYLIIPQSPKLSDYGISCGEVVCLLNLDTGYRATILKDNNYYLMKGV